MGISKKTHLLYENLARTNELVREVYKCFYAAFQLALPSESSFLKDRFCKKITIEKHLQSVLEIEAVVGNILAEAKEIAEEMDILDCLIKDRLKSVAEEYSTFLDFSKCSATYTRGGVNYLAYKHKDISLWRADIVNILSHF